jgi:hypothetical protein
MLKVACDLKMKNEIILYHPDELAEHIEVRLEDETVWLNRLQISSLFGRDVKTIGKHINNVFSEGELAKDSTVANFATVQMEGGRSVERYLEYYNLDVIISVGYRVKSLQGTQFRKWANQVLKEYLLKGYAFNQRVDRIENEMHSMKKELREIKLQLNTNLPPNEGIFFNGQIFDAWVFISGLIKSANTSLILIDNYVDESVLNLFLKRKDGVVVNIYTANLTSTLKSDLYKHNKQYPPIEIKVFSNAHDRFLIIDKNEVYHIGASLKDLGKKLFAFSKMELEANVILEQLTLKL